MTDELREAVDDIIKANPRADRALKAMLAQGMSRGHVEGEICRVLLGALWEIRNIPEADKAVVLDRYLEALERGATAELLFPDGEGVIA